MERIVMSHLGDVVWLSKDSLADPMGEFGAEDDQATRPLAGSLFQRVAAASRIAIPQAPPALQSAPAQTMAAWVPEPPVIAEPVAAHEAAAVRRGRWFIGVAVLGLLTIGQAP